VERHAAVGDAPSTRYTQWQKLRPLSTNVLSRRSVSAIVNEDTLEYRCAAGHYWRENTNGQVTPSWGLGGTFIDVELA
jgi:hypothetical protein